MFMALFSEKMKMAEVIHSNYLLIPVIRRFGIMLGFGDKTIKTLCKEHNIDPEFLITIINTFSNKDYFPEERLQKFNILEFINYLRKTHYYYLNVQVPVIEKHIEALVNSCIDGSKSLILVQTFFHDYKNELKEHLMSEEQITFPYIETLYRLYNNDFNEDEYTTLSHNYSMKRFGEEHSNVDIKLYDLQNILIKYLNGNFSEEHIQAVLFELFRLEKDIKNHTRLEEMILKPMVEDMEQTLKSYSE
jgi:regulator of cell morphogenesis and NO signaling